jgi:hypothetical protein
VFRRWLKSLQYWPSSVYQSIENPTQFDRLPDSSNVELEYPTHQYTFAQNRRHTLLAIGLPAITGLVLFLIGEFFRRPFVPYYHATLAVIGLLLFVWAYFGRVKPLWRWAIYLFVVPVLVAAIFLYHDPYLMFAIAMVLATLLGDRFATHFFQLRTTVPMPRVRANSLRALWAQRLNPFKSKAKGVEFYWLTLLSIPFVCLVIVCTTPDFPSGTYLANLPRLAIGLTALCLWPLFLEIVASFLTARKVLRPRAVLRGFGHAFVEWFTYNRRNAFGPGIFCSPVGSCRHRRWMAMSLILIFAAAIAPLFSFKRGELDRIDANNPALQDRHRTTLPERLRGNDNPLRRLFYGPDPLQDIHNSSSVHPAPHGRMHTAGVLPVATLINRTPLLAVTAAAGDNENDSMPPWKAEIQGLDLQPYQEAMLERMDEQERSAKIKEWKNRPDLQTQPKTPLNAGAQADLSLQEGVEVAGLNWFLALVLNIIVIVVIAVYPALCVVLPPLFVIACCFSTSARVVGLYADETGSNDPDKLLNFKTWEDLVTTVQTSEDETEQDSLFLGVNAHDGTPVIVPRAVYQEHAHLLGDSGSGKTSLGMASLIAQLIRFHDSSLVILDLKGDDLALFEGARIEAGNADKALRDSKADDPNVEFDRYRFRWFTNELGRSTHGFNPLTQAHFQQLSLYQRTDVLTAAMGLQYGTDYGRGYYADANAELLYRVLEECPNISSFRQLRETLQEKQKIKMNPELRRAASHLHAMVSRLASSEALNVADRTDYSQGVLKNSIDMADVFMEPQVVYFHLPSVIGTASSAEIARFALYSLLSAAKFVGPRRKQVYLLIDEFQRIIANNLELVLQTARSMNIGVILANQTLMDLRTRDVDLIHTVRANTRFRQVFAASDLHDLQELVHSSGETLIHNQTWTVWTDYLGLPAGIRGRTLSETISPRLRPNDILLATDHPSQSIVFIRRGAGYAQYGGMPFVMTSTHHIDYDEYDRRKRSAWPRHIEGETIVPTRETEIRPKAVTAESVEKQLPAQEFPDPVIDSPPANDTEHDSARDDVALDPLGPLMTARQSTRHKKRQNNLSSDSQIPREPREDPDS